MALDQELLELAAKAAGYTLGRHTQKEWAFTLGGVEWNPLTDDGDALRLAVALRLDIYQYGNGEGFLPHVNARHPLGDHDASEDHGDDALAATRRAIVRAAAASGRAMP